MKTRTLFCILVLIVVASSASAQNEELASVSGRVTTLWGEPIEQAEVSFLQLEGISGHSPTEKLVQRVMTDKGGNYATGKLPWGQYRVNVDFKGYGHTEVWRFYLWRGANRVLDIGVPMGMLHGIEAAKISGVVRQANNILLRDATVTLVNAYDMRETQQVRTDENGRYSLTEIQLGDYVLYVTKPGFGVSSTTLRLSNGERKTADIRLSPAPQRKPF
jgi:hypothetical protein